MLARSLLNLRSSPMTYTRLVQVQQMRYGCDPHEGGLDLVPSMEKKLQDKFDPVECKVIDAYGDQSSIQIRVVSEKFKGMLPLARHRAINDLLKEEIKKIHAVQIDAKTPSQINKL